MRSLNFICLERNMKKLSSKILVLLITLCFALTFITGCNGGEEGEPSGSTTETTPVTSNSINVFLADEYELVVNDNFQLFYRGVV